MESKKHLIKRARIYDAQERASDHGIGHPGGPTGWRKPRAPPATGNAARLRRLRKGYPKLHAQVMAGEITPYKAATMAGFNRPGPKPKSSRIPTNANSITSTQEMELWLGRSHRSGSAFSDDEQRRRAWLEHRDRLLQCFAHSGRRPQAWWKFEAPFKYPGFNQERSALWAAGLLGAAEARALEQAWREEFDRSLAPGFTFRDLTGWDAHIAHLVFHDVPAALAEAWATPAPDAA
jgi:hypothetical protein